jgi:hypothetical protein
MPINPACAGSLLHELILKNTDCCIPLESCASLEVICRSASRRMRPMQKRRVASRLLLGCSCSIVQIGGIINVSREQ